MSEPMPEIEVGDWVAGSWNDPARVEIVVRHGRTRLRVYLAERAGYLTKREVCEIRKADGRVWRRDGGQP